MVLRRRNRLPRVSHHPRNHTRRSLEARRRRRTLLTLALVLIPLCLAAQTREIRFERIALEHGTTNYRAFDIAQDSVGFLWFATSEGLYRYDGLAYTVYRPRLNDTTGLSSNTIRCLTTDRTGNVWAGTFDGGLECFDVRSESFVHHLHRSKDSTSISGGPITAVLEDHTGTLWIGTENSGLNRLDRATGVFSHFIHEPRNARSLSSNAITALGEDLSGNIWVGTDAGLCALDRDHGTFARYTHSPREPSSLSGNDVSALWCDNEGTLWIGTRTRGVNRLDPGKRGFVHYRRKRGDPHSLSCDSTTSIYGTDPQDVWVGTFVGLNKLDKRTGSCNRYFNDPLNPNSLSSNYILKIAGDRTGTIWVSTDYPITGRAARGVNKIIRKSEQFVFYLLPPEAGSSVGVFALYHEAHGDVVWLGTPRGLRAFNLVTGSSVTYAHDRRNPRSLSDDYVAAISLDPSGTMWVGTWLGGLNKFDRIHNRFTCYRWNAKGSGKENTVMALSVDSVKTPGSTERDIWVGAFRDGLLKFTPSTQKFVHYKHDPARATSLNNDRVMVTYIDRAGNLWVGTDGGGLDRFDRRNQSFVHYLHDDADPRSLRSNRVLTLCEDPDSYRNGGGVLWVGTATGLDRFDVNEGAAVHYSLLDSVSSVIVRGLIPGRDHLWVSTRLNGLFELSYATGKSVQYTADDGLHTDQFTRASCRSSTGEIFLGGDEGFTLFHPDSIRINPFPPPVVLTSFDVFDRPYDLGRPLRATPLIHLNYEQDFFSFRFVALDFAAPSRNRYAYKLDGFDVDWNLAGTRNFAGYTKVDPGTYVFRVRASNSDGVWNDKGASVTLIIDPPYWRTLWFRILAAALAIGILAGAYNYRVAKLLEMQRMRTRIASDLHDDIGSSLSGIALITESMKTRPALAEQDRKRLADATEAARKTADSLKDIVWIVNPEHENLSDIVLRLKDTAAKLLVGIDYSISCKEGTKAGRLDMEFRRHLILMFKEILNNIVKHARATHVEISIAELEGKFHLHVADNGVGFDESTIRRGNGLDNLAKRASQVGGTVRIESSPGKGTTIEFEAPIP